ncbi:MAG: AEC family transporter, partial [Pseudomonadota bacterium]
MFELIETIVLVFGVVAMGYLSGVLKLLPVETGTQLSKFVFTIAVPILLFRTMISADFALGVPWALWVAYFVGVFSTWALGHITMRRIFGRDARAGVVAGLAASFSNLVLIGIPLILGVFGQEGFEILSLIISIHLLVM